MAQPVRIETIDHHSAMDEAADAVRVVQAGQPGRVVVHPMISDYTGVSNTIMVGGQDGEAGRDLYDGYAMQVYSRTAGTSVNTFAIPVNIRLKDIDTISFYEKMSAATASDNLQGISFRLDSDGDGTYFEGTNDMYLINYLPTATGATTWTKRNPLAATTYQLKRWHTRIETPDHAIAADAASQTFALYKATSIGEYMVKKIVWAYTGSADGKWGMLSNLVINGNEYIFRPRPGQVFHLNKTGTGAIAIALKPEAPFRLLGASVHFAQAQTQDTLTIKQDGGRTASVYDTLLYSRATATGSVTDLVIPFGIGYEFEGWDEIDVAYTGGDGDAYGMTLSYELLPI